MNSPSDDLDPTRLESASFDMVRRGFDPTAVRGELHRAAQAIRQLRLERDELAGRLAEFDGAGSDQLEAHQVAEALGAEAAQVIQAAHDAARERADRAEREADAVRDEALAVAESTRADAEASRDELVEVARREAETVTEEGRERGREMVTEAQTVRERMLRDLARKRQTGRAQVEQLRAGRDRLLESLTIAQQSLDTAVADLVNSVPEARAAAERAGMRVTSETVPTPNDLEGEISAARLIGHPLVEDTDTGSAEEVDETFSTAEMEALPHLADLDDDDVQPTYVADAEPAAAAESEAPEAAEEAATDADSAPELYDLEAEPPADEESPEAEPSGSVDEAADGSVADDVFARLRSSQDTDEPADTDNASPAEPAEVDEAEAAADPTDGDEPVPGGIDASRATARAEAADAAAKAMKKVLVEEQGTLLDGIRRSGADAVRIVADDEAGHGSPYEKAAAPALKSLAAELGGSKRVALAAAFAHIHSIALEPVRQRLAEVADRVEDADELSDTVRGLYRESRSRRIPEAAAAAAVAVDGLVAVAIAKDPLGWNVDVAGPCGPDCADNALAGLIAAGDEFPTGDRHPPAHAACTCWLAVAAD